MEQYRYELQARQWGEEGEESQARVLPLATHRILLQFLTPGTGPVSYRW